MSSPDSRIEAIFHEALARAPAKCEAFVAQACAGDEALQHEVQRLLTAHEDAGTYFERPHSPETEAELAWLKPEKERERIGRYHGPYRERPACLRPPVQRADGCD